MADIRIWPGWVAVGALALALAACGDDDAGGGDGQAVEALSADGYVTAGLALCDEAGAGVEAVFPDFGGEPTIEQVQQLGVDLEPIIQAFRNGVGTLAPPDAVADRHEELLGALDDAIATTHEMGATTEGAQAALDAGGPPLDEFSAIADELFPGCTEDEGP